MLCGWFELVWIYCWLEFGLRYGQNDSEVRSNVASKKSVCMMPVTIVTFKSFFLNTLMIFFFSRSICGLEKVYQHKRPQTKFSKLLSLYRLTSVFLIIWESAFSRYSPRILLISAPSYDAMVTSNKLASFFIHVPLLSNNTNFLQCNMMLVVSSSISVYILANSKAFSKRFLVVDG